MMKTLIICVIVAVGLFYYYNPEGLNVPIVSDITSRASIIVGSVTTPVANSIKGLASAIGF